MTFNEERVLMQREFFKNMDVTQDFLLQPTGKKLQSEWTLLARRWVMLIVCWLLPCIWHNKPMLNASLVAGHLWLTIINYLDDRQQSMHWGSSVCSTSWCPPGVPLSHLPCVVCFNICLPLLYQLRMLTLLSQRVWSLSGLRRNWTLWPNGVRSHHRDWTEP